MTGGWFQGDFSRGMGGCNGGGLGGFGEEIRRSLLGVEALVWVKKKRKKNVVL